MRKRWLLPDNHAPDATGRRGWLNARSIAFVAAAVVALGVGLVALPGGNGSAETDADEGDAVIAGPNSTVASPAALANTGSPLVETLEVQALDLGASQGLNAQFSEDLTAGEPTASSDPQDPDPKSDSDSAQTELSSTASPSSAPDSESSAPATGAPTTQAPTTQAPTTQAPTTQAPTTQAPTTQAPTTPAPTTVGNTCSSGARFETVLFDDFNGSSLASHWIPYNSWGGFGTVDGVVGQRTPSAISVSDGLLTITGYGRDGRIETGGMENTVDLQYGRFSFRVRTDNDPSQVYSGVLLTWPQSQNQYRDGENNIFETLVETPGRAPFFSFIHKPNGVASQQQYYRHEADGAQWQVMTMEWTPERIVINREGPGATGSDSWVVNENGNDIIPDAPHHLTVQLDAWKSTPPANPVRLQVDWVEIARYCG